MTSISCWHHTISDCEKKGGWEPPLLSWLAVRNTGVSNLPPSVVPKERIFCQQRLPSTCDSQYAKFEAALGTPAMMFPPPPVWPRFSQEGPVTYDAGWIVKKNQPWKEELNGVLEHLVMRMRTQKNTQKNHGFPTNIGFDPKSVSQLFDIRFRIILAK